jgi:hypothetical protein
MCDYVWVRHHRSPSRSLNSIEGPELALCDWQLVSAMQKSGNGAYRDNTARTNLNFTQAPSTPSERRRWAKSMHGLQCQLEQ